MVPCEELSATSWLRLRHARRRNRKLEGPKESALSIAHASHDNNGLGRLLAVGQPEVGEQVRWLPKDSIGEEINYHKMTKQSSDERPQTTADSWPQSSDTTMKLRSRAAAIRREPNRGHSSRTQRVINNSSILNPYYRWLLMFAVLINLASCYQLNNNLIANNQPPKFITTPAQTSNSGSNSEIVVRVKEGASSIGKLIYTLKGEDLDDDPLTFGLLGSMASDLLRIENVPGNSANVYLRKELDRETTESYQVVITLTDGKLGRGNWITKSMFIIVEDVNDNYPVFGPHRTAISIREDARVPMVVETLEASDQDEGRFGQVIYRLDTEFEDGIGQGGRSAASMFAIETVEGRGVISLISPLDYEQRALYQLRVVAVDRAIEQERLSASTSILISVEDCEDQPPMFTFVPSITRIPENLALGSPVLRVTAVDGDRGVNNPIQYKLVSVNGRESGPERDLFALNQETGQVTVNRELDREAATDQEAQRQAQRPDGHQTAAQPGSYVLSIKASELSSSGSGSQSSEVTTELTVILQDVNDEFPTFSSGAYFGEILENSAAESLVTFIGAPRDDLASGEMLVAPLEPLAPVAKVIDRDQGTNGSFTLHLEGEHSHLFEVWPKEATNEASFIIKVSQAAEGQGKLDFELSKLFKFQVVAKEKLMGVGEQRLRFSVAQMSVYLKDSNDNYPQFESELYRVEIPENAARGSFICQVKATDLDSGIFGSAGIRYTEIRGEKAAMFKLDPISGQVSLRSGEHGFDRETVGQHHLIVEARDANGLGNRNTTQLMLVLTDINDQRPKFLLEQYEAFIYENEADFQSPLQVQAQDGDQPGSANSRLSYSIVAGDPQQNFTIDPSTGRIRLRSSSGLRFTDGSAESQAEVSGLDFERMAQGRDESRQFNLTVRATDHGQPEPLFGQTQVVIIVHDRNDHAPVFSRPIYFKSIREDAKEGSQVIQVQAQDGDHSPLNSRVTYRIASGASDKFVIDSDSGLITVASGANLDIDRAAGGHKRTNYLLSVLALDGSFGQSQKSSSCLVNITIIDVNNKAPEFVSLGGSLRPASGQPTSSQQPAVVYVSEDAPYGLVVSKVVATDLDSSAELRYSINYARSEGRNEEMLLVEPSAIKDIFSIEPIEGTIKVARQLDRELFDQVKLRLQVEDIAAQTADQVAHAHLIVRIADVNDNRPTFKRPHYKAVVNENSISGTSVITLTADDKDLNKTLRYSLEASPEMARLVRINPRSGEVTVNDKIDRELHPMINVTVKAEDHGQPNSLTGSTQLIITVRDENDNNPVFVNSSTAPLGISGGGLMAMESTDGLELHTSERSPKSQPIDGYRSRSLAASGGESERPLQLLAPGAMAWVREDAPIGQQVAYVRAEDPDLGNNGRVTYLLDGASGGGKFRVDRETGVIQVAGPLDRELAKQYTLIIEACDNYDLGYSTGESRRVFTQVTIQLIDVNDNAPLISLSHQSQQAKLDATSLPIGHETITVSQGPFEMPLSECLFINEFQPTNEPITSILVTDADDPSTGNGQADLVIVNQPQGQEPLFRLAPVVNQPTSSESPDQDQPSADITTDESTSSGRSSSWPIRARRQQFTSGSRPTTASSAPSTRASTSGEQQVQLVVSQSLKEKVGNYSILVRATDRGQPSQLSSSKQINVCVADVNNHAPVFSRPPLNFTIRIMENATVGSQVTQVEASDADHGPNGQVQYSLKPSNNLNDWQWFKVDRLTGAITTLRTFNRQQKRYFTFRVEARDFGKPTSLSSDIDINIMIVNSGYYQPEFDSQLQVVQFTENLAPGVEWVTLTPTTNQDDDPALINTSPAPRSHWQTSPCYFIVDSDDQEHIFHLDRYTHKLTSRKELDRERKSNYTLLVQATNGCSRQPNAAASHSSPSVSGRDLRNQLIASHPSIRQPSASSAMHLSRATRSISQQTARSNSTTTVAVAGDTAKFLSQTEGSSGSMNPAAIEALLAADRSLLKVVIKVKDVNDNPPRFMQHIYTGGITTEADFGTVFMIVQAIDADLDSQLTYSIVKPIKRNLITHSAGTEVTLPSLEALNRSPLTAGSETIGVHRSKRSSLVVNGEQEPINGSMDSNLRQARGGYSAGNQLAPSNAENDLQTNNSDDLFLINPQTGEISLNFDPQKHMKGYFEFEIMANDTDGLFDSAKVYIYLLRQDQRVKFVLRLTPQELRQRLNKFRSVLGNITGALVNIDSYKYHENHDGSVDKKKTSLYLHFVNPQDNTIIEVDEVLKLIDKSIEYLDELYKEFHVLSSEAAHLPLSSSALIDPMDQVKTGLFGVSSFLALILVLVIALCLNQRTRYERQLKAATVSAFGGSPLHLDPDYHSQTNLPNTNLHSQDPNPIWMNGYSEQEWLAGGKTLAGGAANQQGAGSTVNTSALGNVGVGIEEVDYLSSGNSDLNSLSGLNSVGQLHYNVTSTATPRDSLSSSHGRQLGSGSGSGSGSGPGSGSGSNSGSGAGSNSGAGSTSTTNERRALCRDTSRRAAQQSSPAKLKVQQYGQRNDPPAEAIGALKGAAMQQSQATTTKKRLQSSDGSSISHSTFGAFKEVTTIYTTPDLHHRHPSPVQQQFILHHQQKQQQQQSARTTQLATSQVNKIASQFNAKLSAQSTRQNQIVISSQNNGNGNRGSQNGIVVQPNGADPIQGIIKSHQQEQQEQLVKQQKQVVNSIKQIHESRSNGNNHQSQESVNLVKNTDGCHSNNSNISKKTKDIDQRQQQQQGQHPNYNETADSFETNLSKLCILNLETTEL